MLSRIFTATITGLTPIKVEVEVDTLQGIPKLVLIGLPNKAVDESKERITSALINCGIRLRSKRTVVNLAPADIRKTSSVLDLAIVVALLKNYGEIDLDTNKTIFFGELSLDGQLKPIKGALPLVLAARNMGFEQVVLPKSNLDEVAVIDGIRIYPLAHLKEFLNLVKNGQFLPCLRPQKYIPATNYNFAIDFSDVHGQQFAKRSLEIAAAGGHNLLMVGPPGAGKSMLAKALMSILPPLTKQEAIEVTQVYSICGLTPNGLIKQRPFRHPHHSSSHISLIGGGQLMKPGEISLAHRGILFLDEFNEFSKLSLESLRQPMQDGNITITRAAGMAKYPASFTLIAAANPCRCGYVGSEKRTCQCSERQVENYQKKISGPILDRIDLYIRVREVEIKKLTSYQNNQEEESKQVLARVIRARQAQIGRFKGTRFITNADLTSKDVKKFCQLSKAARKILNQAAESLHLSARSYFKIIKVAQTIADLQASNMIKQEHVAEALGFRKID